MALKKNLFSQFDSNNVSEFKIFSAPLKVEQNLISFLLKLGISPERNGRNEIEKGFLENVHKLVDYYNQEIMRLNNIAREYCRFIFKFGRVIFFYLFNF